MAINVYYNSEAVEPAPTITYNHELYYSNDSVIGYTYVITLNGFATHIRPENQGRSGISGNLDQIDAIKNIFSKNGVDLSVFADGSLILKAKGSTIRSISFAQSENYYNNYVPYTIEIEFNELDITGCEETQVTACNSSIFSIVADPNNVLTPNLVDIEKYKIKDFNDSWDITIDDSAYDFYSPNTNNVINVQYSITSTGKNYYVNEKLVPAWHQARFFVQDRLYTQIKGLISSIQNIDNEGCSPTDTKSELYEISTTGSGLFQGFQTEYDTVSFAPNYFVYNESINCTTSEAEGTFSATYSCILKQSYGPNPFQNAAIHTFSVSKSYDQSTSNSANFTVQGQVQGLIRGGMIFHTDQFSLPQNGSFLITTDTTRDKYQNARDYYYANVGTDSDIFQQAKQDMDISYVRLLIDRAGYIPNPESFQIDHDYHGGSLNYSATYTTEHAKTILNGFTNISVTRNDPVPVIKEFIIPGRIDGPIIQNIGMRTKRTVSINIDGIKQDKLCMGDVVDICSYFPSLGNVPGLFEILQDRSGQWVITKKSYVTNAIDGSFSVSLEYLCTDEQ
jgi:hypothetical protein